MPPRETDFPAQENLPLTEKSYPYEWLKPTTVAFYFPEETDRLINSLIPSLIGAFGEKGNKTIYPTLGENRKKHLDGDTGAIVTATAFDQIVEKPLLFHTREIFSGLKKRPNKIFTLVSIDRTEMTQALKVFERLATTENPTSKEFSFTGLPETAIEELQNQTREGGPILGLARQMEAQTRCFDVIAVVGDRATGRIDTLIRFDIAGARPEISVTELGLDRACQDLVLRLMTFWSCTQATHHQELNALFSQSAWQEIMATSGKALIDAGRRLGEFGFFTRPVIIKNLIGEDFVAASLVEAGIAENYSAGLLEAYNSDYDYCITTATGSDAYIYKGELGENHITLARDIKEDLSGALILPIEERGLVRSTSEIVEIIGMDTLAGLPWVSFKGENRQVFEVPFFWAKAHGHVMVKSFDPRYVKCLYLEDIYHHYPVSCATQQLAKATIEALRRHLKDPDFFDYYLYVLVQPCHGIWFLERRVEGKRPFELTLEYLERGMIRLSPNTIPQGPFSWEERDGRRFLVNYG